MAVRSFRPLAQSPRHLGRRRLLPPLPASELAERLEKATALVLAENSLGTGFFIDPTHLVTNRHVVEASRDGTVVLISRALDKPLIGTILRKSLPGAVGSLDLALIAVRSGRAPGHLRLASSAPKLASVIASGYPGRVIEHDADFRALQRGDLAAAPDLNLTRGGIQSVQSNPAGVRVIVHTASVMKGNSGGPLVDECGRAIGVNTYINVDLLQAGRISYAQMSEAVVQFAKQAGVDIRLDSSVCTLRD
jgi:S1-C subfamily serine protease